MIYLPVMYNKSSCHVTPFRLMNDMYYPINVCCRAYTSKKTHRDSLALYLHFFFPSVGWEFLLGVSMKFSGYIMVIKLSVM